MICMQCQNDLADCTCDDLGERLKSILDCDFIHIGPEYLARIQKQINNQQKDKAE